LRRLDFQPKRIFITVKAYPTPSISYGETVCCAGVDIDAVSLIRIYPINYRDLPRDKMFKKYTLIEAKCAKDPHDHRPESYRIYQDPDSIKIIEHIDTEDKWERRKQYLKDISIKTLCQLLKEEKINNTSLGIIKPRGIRFSYEKRRSKQRNDECYKSPSLFDKAKRPIEEIPYKFYYEFKCEDEINCPGHELAIIDWEINQAFRDWRRNYQDEQTLLSKIENRWMSIANIENNDVLFFVGNLFRFRDIFTVLGVFYPPKIKKI